MCIRTYGYIYIFICIFITRALIVRLFSTMKWMDVAGSPTAKSNPRLATPPSAT